MAVTVAPSSAAPSPPPAVPGGRAELLPVARPRLPRAAAILPYLRRIDRSGWYSNHGPLAGEFQARLAGTWGLGAAEVALLSSATDAIALALAAAGARPGTRCLMPSWTFVASAGAVVAAGLRPSFVDVDPASWAPDPAAVEALAAADDVGAVLVVSPFGAPLDLSRWDEVSRRTGKPVVIDAAAAFDTLRARGPMRPGSCPVAVSLHATKVFGLGEGGALLCRDEAVMDRVRRLSQFGFLGSRSATLAGRNSKLSEYAAAVGLAALDEWADTRVRWQVAATRYRDALPAGVVASPGFGEGWVTSALAVSFPGPPPEEELRRRGVDTLRWWGPGCHAQPAYRDAPSTTLPNTEALARRTTGLPFWQDLSARDIAGVCGALAACFPAKAAPLAAQRRRDSAAATVFSSRQAMVIGPTPPGTGVMAPATAAHSA